MSWFNPLNWQLDSGFPGAADSAILGINATIDLSASDATVASFQQSTGTLTGAAKLNGAQPMIAALERLRRNEDAPGELPESVKAFGIRGGAKGWMALMRSHPPIEQRIAALRASAG